MRDMDEVGDVAQPHSINCIACGPTEDDAGTDERSCVWATAHQPQNQQYRDDCCSHKRHGLLFAEQPECNACVVHMPDVQKGQYLDRCIRGCNTRSDQRLGGLITDDYTTYQATDQPEIPEV